MECVIKTQLKIVTVEQMVNSSCRPIYVFTYREWGACQWFVVQLRPSYRSLWSTVCWFPWASFCTRDDHSLGYDLWRGKRDCLDLASQPGEHSWTSCRELLDSYLGLQELHTLWVCILFTFTAAGVVQCGGRKTSPRTSTIVQFIFHFWSFEISERILRNQKLNWFRLIF